MNYVGLNFYNAITLRQTLRSCAITGLRRLVLKSSLKDSLHDLGGRPLPRQPGTSILWTLFRQLHSFFLATWPYQQSLTWRISSVIGVTPTLDSSSTLESSTLMIAHPTDHRHFISGKSLSNSAFEGQVSLPYRSTGCLQLLYKSPLLSSETPFEPRGGKRFLNFFHPHCTRVTELASAPPSASSISPR